MSTLEELRINAITAHKAQMTPDEHEKEQKLVQAHQNIVQVMIDTIWKAVQDAVEADPFTDHTVVMNPHEEAELCGLQYKTLLYGTYRKQLGQRDWKQQHFAGITKTPFELVDQALRARGVIKVLDITDQSKSNNILVKIILTPEGL